MKFATDWRRIVNRTAVILVLGLRSTVSAQNTGGAPADNNSGLPVEAIEQIVGIKGDVTHGVLELSVDRDDVGNVQGPNYRPVMFTPSFEINGDIFFQPLSGGKAFLNGDLALREEEVPKFIAALLNNNLVFQAFHQHLPMHPQIWFVHFRGVGDPRVLAHEIRAALNTTSTPLPQAPPANPKTPLDPERLGRILHGEASVGSDGVVTVWIYRTDTITIDGIRVNPQANISTNVEFRPIGGSNAAVVPDFSMTSSEVVPVVDLMLNHLGWQQGCLYNQETDEHPQLYFDHMVKTGDAYDLAKEIRRGLDLTASQ